MTVSVKYAISLRRMETVWDRPHDHSATQLSQVSRTPNAPALTQMKITTQTYLDAVISAIHIALNAMDRLLANRYTTVQPAKLDTYITHLSVKISVQQGTALLGRAAL